MPVGCGPRGRRLPRVARCSSCRAPSGLPRTRGSGSPPSSSRGGSLVLSLRRRRVPSRDPRDLRRRVPRRWRAARIVLLPSGAGRRARRARELRRAFRSLQLRAALGGRRDRRRDRRNGQPAPDRQPGRAGSRGLRRGPARAGDRAETTRGPLPVPPRPCCARSTARSRARRGAASPVVLRRARSRGRASAGRERRRGPAAQPLA